MINYALFGGAMRIALQSKPVEAGSLAMPASKNSDLIVLKLENGAHVMCSRQLNGDRPKDVVRDVTTEQVQVMSENGMWSGWKPATAFLHPL